MANWHSWGSGDPKQLRPEDAKGEFVAMMRDFRQHASRFRPQLPALQSGRGAYADRVNQIVDIAERAGVDVLLMTQPALWRAGLSTEDQKLLWGGGPPLGRFRKGADYYSVEALANGMELYNETLLAVCEDRGIRCLDLASVIPRTIEVFYDDAHFTERGSEMVSEAIAAHLLERESFRQGTAVAH